MGREDTGLVGRGQTMGVTGATDLLHLEGIEKTFEDYEWGLSRPRYRLGSRRVRCRMVRNVSGINLLPKYLVVYKAGTGRKQVDGYLAVEAGPSAGPVDEFLAAAGVVNNDLFWVVIEGPAMCITAPTAAGENVINEAEFLVGLTAAASTHSTTAGRVIAGTFTSTHSTGAPLVNHVLNVVGRALSAKTTANTNADVLADVKIY